jgi:hypothetical protein
MVEIGRKPIRWHSSYVIEDVSLNSFLRTTDVTFDLGKCEMARASTGDGAGG